MERDEGDLEREGREDREEPDLQHRVGEALAAGERALQGREARRAEPPVDRGEAVEEEGGREGAHQEVLHPRFGRLGDVPVPGRQDVEGDRHQLEADEDDEEVVPLHHEHQARGRPEEEGVELALVPLVAREEGVGAERHEGDGREREEVDEPGQLRALDRAREGAPGRVAAEEVRRRRRPRG